MHAAQLTFAWNDARDPGLAGYIVNYGSTSGSYEEAEDVGMLTAYALSDRYFFEGYG